MSNKKKSAIIVGGAAVLVAGGILVTRTGLAQAATRKIMHTTQKSAVTNKGKFNKPTVTGTVASVSGNTITLTSKNGTTYSVDATNAKIEKFIPGTNGTKGTESAIAVSQIQTGDTLRVVGSLSGTNVTATQINDGSVARGMMSKPAVMGTVNAVNGNTLTISGSNNTTYSVDATNAKITKITSSATVGSKPTSSTITVSQIAVGDKVMVQGTVSGVNVSATQIVDGAFPSRLGFGKGNMGVVGTVASISGSTITLTGKNGMTYTINTSGANIQKYTPGTNGAKGTTASITTSQIQTGDTLRVVGTLSGTNVTATQIFDGKFSFNGRK
jgi:hypothetical protein